MIARIRRNASFALTAGLCLAAFGLLWTLIRGRLELPGEVTLALGVLLLAGYIALRPAQVLGALTGRTARHGGNAMLVTLAVVGILILVNVLAARHYKRFDLTEDQEFSLSPQTLQVLGRAAGSPWP